MRYTYRNIIIAGVYSLALLFFPCVASAQETSGEKSNSSFLENVSFEVMPKILGDGFILDIGLGIQYNDFWGGELRFSHTKQTKTIKDDLDNLGGMGIEAMTLDDVSRYEFFLLPALYRWKINDKFSITGGGGFYYDYGQSFNRGYWISGFDDSYWIGSVNVNASTHLIGPLIDVRFLFISKFINSNLKFGIVPIYYGYMELGMREFPMVTPPFTKIPQSVFSSPYLYAGMDFVILKYLNVLLYYDYFRQEQRFISSTYDSTGRHKWIYPDIIVVSHHLMFEISALIPMRDNTSIQLGLGLIRDYWITDGNPLEADSNYFIFSVRKGLH